MLKNKFNKNKIIYVTIMIFVILSAMLMTVGSEVIIDTMTSMNSIFDIAKTPHFLQMHTGDINQDEINAFAQDVDYVVGEETVEMINIDSGSLWYEQYVNGEKNLVSMSGNMMDNGFVKQTEKFDYLLDENNEVINQKDGEVGVPISYKEEYDLNIGLQTVLMHQILKSYMRIQTLTCLRMDRE